MSDLTEIYSHLWAAYGDELAVLDRNPHARPRTFLIDVAAPALDAHSIVADVGCGRGNWDFQLAARFNCRVIGIDVVFPALQSAAAIENRSPFVHFVQGDIEQLPLKTASISFVWCRDMLLHIRQLHLGIQECHRVLRSGGRMLVWATVETDLMEPREASWLYTRLGVDAASVSKANLEAAFASSELIVLSTEMLGSELIELYQDENGSICREILRIDRMRRMRELLRASWGETRYETTQALYHWIVYHLLGKLSSGYYLLEKPH